MTARMTVAYIYPTLRRQNRGIGTNHPRQSVVSNDPERYDGLEITIGVESIKTKRFWE